MKKILTVWTSKIKEQVDQRSNSDYRPYRKFQLPMDQGEKVSLINHLLISPSLVIVINILIFSWLFNFNFYSEFQSHLNCTRSLRQNHNIIHISISFLQFIYFTSHSYRFDNPPSGRRQVEGGEGRKHTKQEEILMRNRL